VNALHPGYGFLSENAAFAEIRKASGICLHWAGSRGGSAMGVKERAREFMRDAGVRAGGWLRA